MPLQTILKQFVKTPVKIIRFPKEVNKRKSNQTLGAHNQSSARGGEGRGKVESGRGLDAAGGGTARRKAHKTLSVCRSPVPREGRVDSTSPFTGNRGRRVSKVHLPVRFETPMDKCGKI